MAALMSLQNYEGSSDESNDEKEEESDGFNAHLKSLDKTKSISSSLAVVSAPEVEFSVNMLLPFMCVDGAFSSFNFEQVEVYVSEFACLVLQFSFMLAFPPFFFLYILTLTFCLVLHFSSLTLAV
jgi:hypothetical protein